MERMQALYQRTREGARAAARIDSGLPHDYRALLEATARATLFDDLAAALPQCPPEHVLRCLDDLEAIGLVETVALGWLLALYALDGHAVGPSSPDASAQRQR